MRFINEAGLLDLGGLFFLHVLVDETFDRRCGLGTKKRYKNVTALSWLTVANFLKFMQNTFFSKY